MQKWAFNHLEIETINLKYNHNLLDELQLPTHQRPGFCSSASTVTIPRFFYRIIGVDPNVTEADYRNWVQNHYQVVSKYDRLGLCLSNGFERDLPETFLQRFDGAWRRILLLSEIEPHDCVALLERQQLFPAFPNETLNRQLRSNFGGMLEYYFELNQGELDVEEFRNILLYGCFWLQEYAIPLMLEFDYAGVNPKVFYYGMISREEILFLFYLSSLGMDVTFFNSQSECDFPLFDPDKLFTQEILYYQRSALEPLHVFESRQNTETIARLASQEIDDMLQQGQEIITKPWQLADCLPDIRTMKTTYAELSLLWQEEAMFRPYFSFDQKQKQVCIPNLFAKIIGTHSNLSQYLQEVDAFCKADSVLLFQTFPLVKNIRNQDLYEPLLFRNPEGHWTVNRVLLPTQHWWPYRNLRTKTQEMLIAKIIDFMKTPRVFDRQSSDERDMALLTLQVTCQLDEAIQKMIHAFDYPKQVPKVVILNDGHSGPLQLEDAILLTFLNGLGFDLLLFNPAGYNDIEQFVHPDLIDRHHLETVIFRENLFQKRVSITGRGSGLSHWFKRRGG